MVGGSCARFPVSSEVVPLKVTEPRTRILTGPTAAAPVKPLPLPPCRGDAAGSAVDA